ncbi:MAG: proteasome subunit beta [Nanoarchaeota archaeon]
MENKDILKTGTTTVGLVCKDCIILAADKRATIGGGYIYSKKAEKIMFVNDNIAVTTAGMVSDVQILVKLLQSELQIKKMRRGKKCNVKEAANLLARMVYQNVRKFSTIPGLAQFIMAGRDDSGLHLYDIFPDGSVNEVDDYLASGSGSIVAANSILDTLFKKDMKSDEGIKLAVKAVNAALQRDTASGDGIDIVSITKEGIKKVLTKDLKTELTI